MDPKPQETKARSESLILEIFVTSLAALLLEIAYTRIFSFKVFYYFTYLIIGIGLLGIGGGGVLAAMSAKLRSIDVAKLLPALACAGGASILAGYAIISPLQLNVGEFFTDPAEIAKIVFVSLILTVPFLCVGLIVSIILGARPSAVNRLYGADLLGAALGCTLCIPLLKWLDPPRTIVLSGLLLAAGGLRLAWPHRALRFAGLAVVALAAVPVVVPSVLRDPVVSETKSLEDFRSADLVRFSKWHPVFRIDVAQHPLEPDDLYLLFHDGQPGSGLRRFDGDLTRFSSLRKDARSLPFEVAKKNPRVLIIGAAGGHEILASLFFDAAHITGIELNPVTYSLLTDVYHDWSGRLPDHPKVDLINGDGRWFMKQSDEKYDLIWFVAPDSYAAMNAATSGAFVLSESYLYTAEMIEESLRHLTPEGIVCTQFGELDYDHRPNRTTRYLATAREAHARAGLPDGQFYRHVMIASTTGFPPFLESVVLLGKQPFTEAEIDGFVDQTAKVDGGIVRYVPSKPPDETRVNQVIVTPKHALDDWFERQPYDLTPVVDDSPFFWHFARFRDAIFKPVPKSGEIMDYEDAVAEQVTLALLGVVVFLAGLLLLLPFLTVGTLFKELPHKANVALYFAALGLGFMFLEVTLIQKFTLFLGYPTYSLSVTLFGLLVFSGVGSLVSARFDSGGRALLFRLFALLAALVIAYQLVFPVIVDNFIGQALALRIAITIALIAPVGLCLGAFLPLGLAVVAAESPHARVYVAWAWAINGFFSVIASILSTILAMAFGFKVLLMLALGIYLVGVFALSTIPRLAKNPRAAGT